MGDRQRGLAGLISFLVLAALTLLSLWTVAPPAPAGQDAPESAFSAGRAFHHVRTVGARVHPAGSPAADEVRRYIVDTLTGLGLRPEVQDAVGAYDNLGGRLTMARVRNVVAVLPGTQPTGRVFLVAHYDSVQVSYGANDDGAGVATLLETARVLTRDPAPRNDLVFVFTDAEEACLCGAEAFVRDHPLAAEGGVVLNLEARGASGPAIMFETSRSNADLIALYGRVPYPVATSMAVEVYRILPNDTDFTPFLHTGRFSGLNSAYIDGSAVYHSPQDRPEYMDQASLQHHGDNALALTRELSGADIASLNAPGSGDATYFPVLGLLLRYPGWLTWPLAVAALLATAGLALLARARSGLSWPRLATGFGLGLVPLLLAPVAAQVLWLLLTTLRPGYAEMIDPWHPGWFRLGLVALVATVLLTWYGLLRRRVGAWALAVGALGWLSLLGLVLAAITPGGSYLASLPALAGALAGIVALRLRSGWSQVAVLTGGGAVGVLVLAPTVLLFFPALGLATGAAPALFAMLLGLAVLPVAELLYPGRPTALQTKPTERSEQAETPSPALPEMSARPRRIRSAAPALVAGALAAGCVGAGLAVDRLDAAHPSPTQLMYALDADDRTALWVSQEADPQAWTSGYAHDHADLSAAFPVLPNDTVVGPAPPADLPPPVLTVKTDSTAGSIRTLTVTLTPRRQARLAALAVRNVPVRRATVAGREVPVDEGRPFQVEFHAPPPDGVEITLVVDGTGPVELRVLDGSDGLGGLPGFGGRPPGVGIKGSHSSELLLVATTVTV